MVASRATFVCAVFIAAGQTLGGITVVSGPAMHIANPVNQKYTANPYNFSTDMFYWTERTAHLLTSDVVVSILPPASFPTTFTTHSNDNSLFVPMGTTVDSYFVHFDPEGATAVTRFQFDDPIVGLITNSRDIAANDHFMLSDHLIDPLVPAANIPVSHFNNRGIELGGPDTVHWISPTEVEFDLGAGNPGDQIRILTSPVPEPASLLTLTLGLVGLVRCRRHA